MNIRCDDVMPNYNLLACALICVASLAGCGRRNMDPDRTVLSAIRDVPTSSWEQLSSKKIFFGHQSVGLNILEGLEQILADQKQIGLTIVEVSTTEALTEPALFHAAIGTNTDPLSKIDAFRDMVASDLGRAYDIAFFKFCYLDITADTDVSRVFAQYHRAIAGLRKLRPEVKLVHVTVPLTIVTSGLKAHIKRIIGQPLGGYADNARRNEFNLLMRSAYAGKEPLFDLALLESTRLDGTRSSYVMDGKQYYCLASDLTSDGGHLNAVGRYSAAGQLLILLSQVDSG
jgi:hypothetical protein